VKQIMLNIKSPQADMGVIVARFQTPYLTPGHCELIETVRARHSKFLIVLGVARVIPTKKNPLDFATRQRMLQEAYPGVEVLALPDTRSDAEWSKNLDQLIRIYHPHESVALYGGRDSFAQCYSGQFRVAELEAAVGESGTQARAGAFHAVRGGEDFRAGICYAVANRYPIKNPTVDVAVTKDKGSAVLLAHKNEDGEGLWRFIGGHIDLGESAEQAARREVQEETGVSVDQLTYVTSCTVDDWRYAGTGDGIFTTLFEARYAWGGARAADDIQQVEWFEVSKIDPLTQIVPEHRALWAAFVKTRS
jgi:bifunctional NMN adenylyltransferase/nudix hydrolase